MSYGYCQTQIEGGKKCKEQCDHCKEYYKPLETELELKKISKKKSKQIAKLLLEIDNLPCEANHICNCKGVCLTKESIKNGTYHL